MRYFWILLCGCIAFAAMDARAQDAAAYNKELAYRIKFGRLEDVTLLLDHGADPNYITEQGDPVLMLAVGRNDLDAVHMAFALLDKGANPNTPDKTGAVPILIAAGNGQRDLVEKLIAKGAEFRFNGPGGVPLVTIARNSPNPDAAQPIQTALDEEDTYLKNAYSPERFEGILRRYSYFFCEYQYWNYYLLSKQDPKNDAATRQNIDTSKKRLLNQLTEIATYYPKTPKGLTQSIEEDSDRAIRANLEDMVSNRNRAEQGVGSKGDDDKRCQAVAAHLHLSY